jgi:hypothetical protein
VTANGSGLCGIVVGGESVDRVIGILSALAFALETRNLALTPSGQGITVTAEGEAVAFKISEYVKREKHVPTVEELAAEERRRKRLHITWDSPYGREYPEWDFTRTGQLSLEIENHYLTGFRRSWNDGKHQRLEALIDEIVAGIIAYGMGLKLRREEHERCQRNWERQRRVRARAEARQERETERAKVLDELVKISVEAAQLRTWLAEVSQCRSPLSLTNLVDLSAGPVRDSSISITRLTLMGSPRR